MTTLFKQFYREHLPITVAHRTASRNSKDVKQRTKLQSLVYENNPNKTFPRMNNPVSCNLLAEMNYKKQSAPFFWFFVVAASLRVHDCKCKTE